MLVELEKNTQQWPWLKIVIYSNNVLCFHWKCIYLDALLKIIYIINNNKWKKMYIYY